MRNSPLFLNFPVIGSLNSSETRIKFDPHCKSYEGVPVLWDFDNSGRYGLFSYFGYFWLKSHSNGMDGVRP